MKNSVERICNSLKNYSLQKSQKVDIIPFPNIHFPQNWNIPSIDSMTKRTYVFRNANENSFFQFPSRFRKRESSNSLFFHLFHHYSIYSLSCSLSFIKIPTHFPFNDTLCSCAYANCQNVPYSDFVSRFHGTRLKVLRIMMCFRYVHILEHQLCDKRGLTRTEFPTWPSDSGAILSPFIVCMTMSLIRDTQHCCLREKIAVQCAQ